MSQAGRGKCKARGAITQCHPLPPLPPHSYAPLKHCLSPLPPCATQVMNRIKQIEAQAAQFAAEKQAADTPYAAYTVAKKHECEWAGSRSPQLACGTPASVKAHR